MLTVVILGVGARIYRFIQRLLREMLQYVLRPSVRHSITTNSHPISLSLHDHFHGADFTGMFFQSI